MYLQYILNPFKSKDCWVPDQSRNLLVDWGISYLELLRSAYPMRFVFEGICASVHNIL